jgi:hypothetical protein
MWTGRRGHDARRRNYGETPPVNPGSRRGRVAHGSTSAAASSSFSSPAGRHLGCKRSLAEVLIRGSPHFRHGPTFSAGRPSPAGASVCRRQRPTAGALRCGPSAAHPRDEGLHLRVLERHASRVGRGDELVAAAPEPRHLALHMSGLLLRGHVVGDTRLVMGGSPSGKLMPGPRHPRLLEESPRAGRLPPAPLVIHSARAPVHGRALQ